MILRDHLETAVTNLRKRKLRTVLTVSGVTIGIAALLALVAFGAGIQDNIDENFRKMDLFRSITVYPKVPGDDSAPGFGQPFTGRSNVRPERVLDAAAMAELERIPGVEAVFPDLLVPAQIVIDGQPRYVMIQGIPASFSAGGTLRLKSGRPFRRDDEEAVIVNESFLRSLRRNGQPAAVPTTVRIVTLSFDALAVLRGGLSGAPSGGASALKRREYEVAVVGVAESFPMTAGGPVSSSLFLPIRFAESINTLPFRSVWDIFRFSAGDTGHTAVNVRFRDVSDLPRVRSAIESRGFRTFALLDQMREMKINFLIMNVFITALGLIALVVATLGIINTMVMAVLERYREIGLMKAIGADHRDIRNIFLAEAALIGFAGGVSGLALGWAVSRIVNHILNAYMMGQGIPYVDYFHYPLWLCLGSLTFSVALSLLAGVYPARRAARVDPVEALRHE